MHEGGAVSSSKHTRLAFERLESNMIEGWKGISLLSVGTTRSYWNFTRSTDHKVNGSLLRIRLSVFFLSAPLCIISHA